MIAFSMARKARTLGAVMAIAVLPGCSCEKTPEPPAPSKTSAPAGATGSNAGSSTTAQAAAAGPGEIAWDVPARWKQIPNPNGMRVATYLIARADGDSEDGEMGVSRVGGSVEANLGRWKAQFDPVKADSAKRQERTIAGLRVTIFETAGTYTGMVVKGQATKPRESWAMLAAIVEVKGGDPWFFKLTGPEKTLSAARSEFESLANSVRPK
jgi:hypothetical protein